MSYIYTLKTIFLNRKYLRLFAIYNVFFFLLYIIYQNMLQSLEIFNINIFSFSEKLIIFLKSIFDFSFIKDMGTFLLFIIFIISISLFTLLSKALYDKTGEINKNKSFWGSIWIFISILGLSCVSCGIGLLASILSFLGFSSIMLYLPLHGLEFGFIGLFFLNISNFFLLKRLKNPFVCD